MKVTLPGSPLPLELLNRRFRLVVLECLYDTIENKVAQELLGKLTRLKIAGYRAEYPYGAIPVDTGDFVGTHLLLCEEDSDGSLEPIMGFKSVSLRRCQIHGLEFPAFHLFPKSGYENHKQGIHEAIETAAKRGEEIAYNGSWTVRRDVKQDRVLTQLCYDTTLLLLVRYYTDHQILNVLAGAAIRFKVEKFKEFMGFEHLSLRGDRLPTFPCKPFFDEEVALMVLHRFTPEAHALAARYQDLWKQRLVISAPPLTQQNIPKKAA